MARRGRAVETWYVEGWLGASRPGSRGMVGRVWARDGQEGQSWRVLTGFGTLWHGLARQPRCGMMCPGLMGHGLAGQLWHGGSRHDVVR